MRREEDAPDNIPDIWQGRHGLGQPVVPNLRDRLLRSRWLLMAERNSDSMMQVARKMALLDYHKCNPAECNDDGICAAALACPSKLLQQEEPNLAPMTEPSFCRACGDCVRACPMGAIEVVRV